jgi:hypothetical protein
MRPRRHSNLVAVFQTAGLDGFGQALERLVHAVGKSAPDGFLFFLSASGAA